MIRPIDDDVVLYTSLRNTRDDDEAYQIARRLLDFTAERWTPSQRPLTKLWAQDAQPVGSEAHSRNSADTRRCPIEMPER